MTTPSKILTFHDEGRNATGEPGPIRESANPMTLRKNVLVPTDFSEGAGADGHVSVVRGVAS